MSYVFLYYDKKIPYIYIPHFIEHIHKYTGGGNVWSDIARYIVKWTQEKWASDSHDVATPLSYQLQVTEDFFISHNFFIMEK